MKIKKVVAFVIILFLLGGICMNTSFYTRKREESYALLKEKYQITEAKAEKKEEKEEIQQENTQGAVNNPVETVEDNRTTENIIWDFLTENGFSKTQAAAIIGNMYQESGLNPARVESNGVGIGLIQWSYGRRAQLEEYAKSMGKDWTDLNSQLEFFLKEWKAGKQIWGENKFKFNNPYSVDEATEAFCWGFERPNKQKANIERRKQKAWEAYYNNVNR